MDARSTLHDPSVDSLRAFNRFYTRRIGLLDEGLQRSTLPLPDVRVLYELAHGTCSTVTDLARELALDLGYVSRLVQRLHARKLVSRSAAVADARRNELSLTAKGRKELATIEASTRDQLGSLLEAVPADGKERLTHAMRTIQDLLDPQPPAQAGRSSVVFRDPRPGDLGWVIHRQTVLYAQEYGWDWTYEGLVAEIVGRFVKDFDASFERCWIAERDGAIVGSVFVVRKSARVAQLRLLYVEPAARGLKIGRQLVDACVAFARAKGYRRITLWTNDVLVAARKIYQDVGFVLVDEERHRSFGKDLVGQHWELRL